MTEIVHEVENLFHRKVTPRMLTMQDISNWQASVYVATLPAEIIAIKATEGTGYVSPSFHEQWIGAKAAKKVRVAYHYNHPSLSAISQARAFLNTVNNSGLETGDLLAIDNEVNDGLNPAQTAANVLEFVKLVNAETKASTIVYTFLNFAETGHCAGLGSSPLWIADPSSPPGQPRIPAPWTVWSFHQYAIVRGIDTDIANFTSITELDKLAVLPKPPPLQPDQIVFSLTDGKTVKDTIVMQENLVSGFKFTAGDAILTVTDRGA